MKRRRKRPLPLSFFPVPCGALEPFLCFRLPQVRLNCENQRCGFGTALYTQAGGEHLLDHSPSPSSTQPPPWGDLWGCRGGRALPTPTLSPNTLPAGHCALGRPGLTHKVRSLGMWLKLDTGMVVMLLLFRVLSRVGGNQGHLTSAQQEAAREGGDLASLSHRAHGSPTQRWAGPCSPHIPTPTPPPPRRTLSSGLHILRPAAPS